MRALQCVFLGMFIYGLLTGMYGPGLLAGLVLMFSVFAGRRFDAHDKAWAADPRNAKPVERPTSDALNDHDCECVRSEF